MRRALVDHVGEAGEDVALDVEASKHLVQVLRMDVGDAVVLFDGEGREAPAELVVADRRAAVARVTGPPVDRLPPHEVVLLIGLPKGPAMDLAVRQATEAGATRILPVRTARSVPRGGQLDRWRRIAASAAAQCGRADRPTVEAPLEVLGEALAEVASIADKRVAHPGASGMAPADGDVVVFIGPEGGLTDAEIDEAQTAGFILGGLGPWILRTSTAAAVAVAAVAPRVRPL